MQVFGSHSVDARIPVFISVNDLIRSTDCRGYIINVFDSFFYSCCIVEFQLLTGAGSSTHTAGVGRVGGDDKHVAAQTGNGVRNIFSHSHADGNHDDNGGDTDNNAEHGQDGAKFITQKGS